MTSPDFPFSLASRESEIVQASNIAAANEHVRSFLHALIGDGFYCLEINGQHVLLEGPGDVDVAYRLFLASPQAHQASRRAQATTFYRNGELHKTVV